MSGYHPTAMPERSPRPRYGCQRWRSIRRLPPLDTMAMARCGRFTDTTETTETSETVKRWRTIRLQSLHLNVLAELMPHHRAMEGHTKPQEPSAAIDGLPSHGDAGKGHTATVRLSAMAIHPPPSTSRHDGHGEV